jgi:hypothetical protein
VNAGLVTLLLALGTIGWFALALLPAIRELAARTDVEPLRLRRGGGDVRHFALTFKEFVDAELDARPPETAAPRPGGSAIQLRDGQPAWLVPATVGQVTFPVGRMPQGTLASHVVLSEAELAVPNGSSLLKELYVAKALSGGVDCTYRAVLSLNDVSLGARSSVLRWIDASGRLEVGERSVLYGRASAGSVMRLMDGVRFQRVAAPTISFGTPGVPSYDPSAHPSAALETPVAGVSLVPRARMAIVAGTRTPLEPPPGVIESFGRWLIEGDFVVPDGEYVAKDLVVTGVLHIGAGARVLGAVKSAHLFGGPAAIYNGAVIATHQMELGAGSEVAGPIVVEGEVLLGAGSRVGSLEHPTTISAVSVLVGRDSTVHG